MERQLGYCTNVHAGVDLETTRANLETYALAVKQRVHPEGPMGVGLWLSASAAARLVEEDQLAGFADWLGDVGLLPYTLNGFPYGDFHQQVVKQRVYLPAWDEPERLAYTRNLISILDGLLPPEMPASISTLPICWGDPAPSADRIQQAAEQLSTLAGDLERLFDATGRRICLCLEPEPGCLLQYADDVVRFFENYLLPGGHEERLRQTIQVCHDVCHAAVMFEEQTEVLKKYADAGIGVGKVQVSSAVVADWDRLAVVDRPAVRAQLAGFEEPRYLHQTVSRPSLDEPTRFHTDLHEALHAHQDARLVTGQWRVHFHVPIYLKSFGLLETSQPQILECLEYFRGTENPPALEVETYAWNVLPAGLQQPDLAAGIAQEIEWLAGQLATEKV